MTVHDPRMLLSNLEVDVEVESRMESESKSGLEISQVVVSKLSWVMWIRLLRFGRYSLGNDESL